MTSFNGKVIAVTGAASGIGLSIAQLLAESGASLSLADLQQTALQFAAEAIRTKSPGTKVLTTQVDVRDRHQVDAWIERTVKELSALDGAVNFTDVLGKKYGLPVSQLDEEDWDFVLGTNLTSMMHS